MKNTISAFLASMLLLGSIGGAAMAEGMTPGTCLLYTSHGLHTLHIGSRLCVIGNILQIAGEAKHQACDCHFYSLLFQIHTFSSFIFRKENAVFPFPKGRHGKFVANDAVALTGKMCIRDSPLPFV